MAVCWQRGTPAWRYSTWPAAHSFSRAFTCRCLCALSAASCWVLSAARRAYECVEMSHLQYKVLLYSLDGRLLSAYCAYEWSLGIKSVAWSPSSQFLAIGSYDGKVGSGSGRRPAPQAAERRQPVSYLHVILTVPSPGSTPKSCDLEDDN